MQDSMAAALAEALKRRKMNGGGQPAEADPNAKGEETGLAQNEQQKYDLAPEVKDSPAKVEIEVSTKPQGLEDLGLEGHEQNGPQIKPQNDMSSFVTPEEERQLKSNNDKPKSLLERAQRAFLNK